MTGTNCEINMNCESGYHGQNCDIYCPTDEPNYRLIEGQCFYYEVGRRVYEENQNNCATKFPDGRLFEPQSKNSLDKGPFIYYASTFHSSFPEEKNMDSQKFLILIRCSLRSPRNKIKLTLR